MLYPHWVILLAIAAGAPENLLRELDAYAAGIKWLNFVSTYSIFRISFWKFVESCNNIYCIDLWAPILENLNCCWYFNISLCFFYIRNRVFQTSQTRPPTRPQLEPQLNPNLTRVGVRVGVECLNAIYSSLFLTSTHTSTSPGPASDMSRDYYKQQHVNNTQHQLEYQPWHPPPAQGLDNVNNTNTITGSTTTMAATKTALLVPPPHRFNNEMAVTKAWAPG